MPDQPDQSDQTDQTGLPYIGDYPRMLVLGQFALSTSLKGYNWKSHDLYLLDKRRDLYIHDVKQ